MLPVYVGSVKDPEAFNVVSALHPCSYSRLLFFNQLPTLKFIETPEIQRDTDRLYYDPQHGAILRQNVLFNTLLESKLIWIFKLVWYFLPKINSRK